LVPAEAKKGKPVTIKRIEIPALQQKEMHLTLAGDRPLLVNNKMGMIKYIHEKYHQPGGKSAAVQVPELTDDEKYLLAFYTMPDSPYPAPNPKGHYGIPTSGILKCACTAIRSCGFTDNAAIGLIGRSFSVKGVDGGGGLSRIKFRKLVRDVRGVTEGKCPALRHRPMFLDWSITISVLFNVRILSEEAVVNLFMNAGQYVGLCEMRKEKKQGECGGFVVKTGR